MSDEALIHVFQALNRLRIAYMLTGSYASNIYGRVRSTFDADLVVAFNAKQLKQFTQELDKEFYFDATTLPEARESGGQLNAVHRTSGLKIDFYLLKDEEHEKGALERRRANDLWGEKVWVISPEDLILAKLGWAKQGGSQRQVEDARGIWELQKADLDLNYLSSAAKKLALQAELARISKD